jgi:hypothetical protein
MMHPSLVEMFTAAEKRDRAHQIEAFVLLNEVNSARASRPGLLKAVVSRLGILLEFHPLEDTRALLRSAERIGTEDGGSQP